MSFNHRCDRRVCYWALIFAADIVPSLSTIQWDLKKPACESTESSAKPLKKKISCQTQKCNFWKRPSTDFDKNYIFGIGTSSAIEWYLSFLLSISCPSDEPWGAVRRQSHLRHVPIEVSGSYPTSFLPMVSCERKDLAAWTQRYPRAKRRGHGVCEGGDSSGVPQSSRRSGL